MRVVCIRADRQLDAQFDRPAHAAGRKVQPVRMRIDLDRRSRLRCSLKNGFHVQVRPFTPADQATRWVCNDIHVRIPDGGQNPLRCAFPTGAESGVQRGNHQVQFCQYLIWIVKRAIGSNLDLSASQDAQVIVAGILLCDFRSLANKVVRALPTGDRHALTMIGDQDIVYPRSTCRRCHFGE